ncbi:hypothetical protein [Dyella telluris]|uniref:ATP-dependent DNA ligase family profile domain-containing protein n=1 Tax=Dyella telluris TaxID=2763498 RepID=A0A7G8Q4D5_9GAMM|nr:hypothetical protein [Dyella telluris]QNK01643.1 hypothetical protein H8F01_00235 [Dyella telluris]
MSTTPNIDAIHDLLVAIGAAKGKTKLELLENFVKDADETQVDYLKRLLKFWFDDQVKFGITSKQLPKQLTDFSVAHVTEGNDLDSDYFIAMREIQLATGTGATDRRIKMLEDIRTKYEQPVLKWSLWALDKNLKIGIQASSVNKVIPGLLSEFGVMLAHPFNVKKVSGWPRMIEPKLDGMRTLVVVDTVDWVVDFYTRAGNPIPSLVPMTMEVIDFVRVVMDEKEMGRIVCLDAEATSGSFNESVSALRSDDPIEEGTLHVFDVLGLPGTNLLEASDAQLEEMGTQRQRRKLLEAAFKAYKETNKPKFLELPGSYWAASEDEIWAMYEAARNNGLEGLIIKDPDAFYRKKRDYAWMKIKAEETMDLQIIGFFEGTGAMVGTLGGIVVDFKGEQVKVGSGFSLSQRGELWEALNADMEKTAGRQVMGMLAEVQYQEVTPAGSLRHPVFKRLRTDKAEISW